MDLQEKREARCRKILDNSKNRLAKISGNTVDGIVTDCMLFCTILYLFLFSLRSDFATKMQYNIPRPRVRASGAYRNRNGNDRPAIHISNFE